MIHNPDGTRINDLQSYIVENRIKVVAISIFVFLFMLSFIFLVVGNSNKRDDLILAGAIILMLDILYGVTALVTKCCVNGQWNCDCNCCNFCRDSGYSEIV